MRTFIKKLKNSLLGKFLKLIFNLIKWAIEILIITIAIIIVVQRVTNNENSFLGYRIFNVASGSMEPEYAVGDILISKEQDPSTIKVGDNVVYVGNKSDYKGKIITHAVIQIDRNEKGEYLFHTKGTANTVEDPIVHEDQLYGTVVSNNQVLAFLCRILTNKYGLYFVVIVPIILYAFVEFVKVQGKKIEEERAEEEKERREKEKAEQEAKRIEKQERVQLEQQAAQKQEEKEQIEQKETASKETKKRKKIVQEEATEEKVESVEKKPRKRTKKTAAKDLEE